MTCVLSSALADKIITDWDASPTIKAGVGSTWVDTYIAVSSHKQRCTLAVVTWNQIQPFLIDAHGFTGFEIKSFLPTYRFEINSSLITQPVIGEKGWEKIEMFLSKDEANCNSKSFLKHDWRIISISLTKCKLSQWFQNF